MPYQLKNKYKFVYDEDCCNSSIRNETVICDSCRQETCIECAVMLDGVYLHRECSGSLRKDKNLLESFQIHNLKAKEDLFIEGFEFDVPQIVNRDKASCAVNIESEKLAASLIMWDSGECELTVMDQITASLVFYIYRVLDNEIELQSYLNDTMGVLREIESNS
jgi:hypothetical protein